MSIRIGVHSHPSIGPVQQRMELAQDTHNVDLATLDRRLTMLEKKVRRMQYAMSYRSRLRMLYRKIVEVVKGWLHLN